MASEEQLEIQPFRRQTIEGKKIYLFKIENWGESQQVMENPFSDEHHMMHEKHWKS